MRRWLAAATLAVWAAIAVLWLAAPAHDQQLPTIAPTPPATDNGDRIATTAWVNNWFGNGVPLATGKIWIGSAGGIATAQTPSGDCSLSIVGIIVCTQSAGNFNVLGNLTVTGTSIFNGATFNGISTFNGILLANAPVQFGAAQLASAKGLVSICSGAPIGAGQFVRKWLTVQDQSGASYYIPLC